MRVERLFSKADLAAIGEATAVAESRTGGEIVPYIVERVIDRDAARWRGAALGSLGGALVAGLVNLIGEYWGGYGVLWITVPAMVGAGVGYLLAGIDAIGRRLIPDDVIDWYVRLRAEAAFLEEEVFSTRDRTGILIFLALFEHEAVILADEGIHRAVPEGEWEELVADLVTGIRTGRAAGALTEIIDRCGRLLERYEVERRVDDEDELADAPRLRER
jgi:putative membrane protein